MKLILRFLIPAISLICLFTSCEDNTDDVAPNEFTVNWPERNATYFLEQLHAAQDRIAEAQALHGDDWENHCDDRIYPSYAKGSTYLPQDSIIVRIIERGSSNVKPYATDSVSINYIGRLIPTESYPLGRVFDHSGLYESEEEVFNPDFAYPTKFEVRNTVEGFTTVLMQMHLGDRLQVIIPHELGYADKGQGVLPSYSTLRFELQLKRIKRN